jgi:hypothetical protein
MKREARGARRAGMRRAGMRRERGGERRRRGTAALRPYWQRGAMAGAVRGEGREGLKVGRLNVERATWYEGIVRPSMLSVVQIRLQVARGG